MSRSACVLPRCLCIDSSSGPLAGHLISIKTRNIVQRMQGSARRIPSRAARFANSWVPACTSFRFKRSIYTTQLKTETWMRTHSRALSTYLSTATVQGSLPETDNYKKKKTHIHILSISRYTQLYIKNFSSCFDRVVAPTSRNGKVDQSGYTSTPRVARHVIPCFIERIWNIRGL
jgi:hypothetical protein